LGGAVRDSIDDVIAMWKLEGVELNPAASESDLQRLSTFLRCSLPADVEKFYRLANGVPDGDSRLMTFWSIEEIATDPDSVLEGDDRRTIAFAHAMAFAWYYRYVATPDGVSVVSDLEPERSWPSLSSFLRNYLDDPSNVAHVD
jgi:hypothetical protein